MSRFVCLMVLASCGPMYAADRPNVLLILADDFGFSDLCCFGGEIAKPHLDTLAGNGLRFRQFYNCTRRFSSRASLMTRLYPHQAGVGNMNNRTEAPGYKGFPQQNMVTIAGLLKAARYHTSMVGNWHLSAGPKTPRTTDRGFAEFYSMIGGFNSCFQEDPIYTRVPGESTDASAKHPAVVAELTRLADTIRADMGDSLTGVKGSGLSPAGRDEK